MASDQLISICILGVFILIALKARFFDRIKLKRKSKYATK